MRRTLTIVGVLVLVGVIVGIARVATSNTSSHPGTIATLGKSGGRSAGDPSTTRAPTPGVTVPLVTVKVTSCGSDFIGQVEAKGTVRNTGATRSNFAIVVVVTDTQGTQVDSTSAVVNNVAPDALAQWDADDFATDYQSGFACRVVSARRSASAA